MKNIILFISTSLLLLTSPTQDSYNIIDDSLYYIHNNYLYKYQNQETTKKKLPTNQCTINYYIECTTPTSNIVYDFAIQEIYKSYSTNLIPYKDTFLSKKDNILYLNQNNKEIAFQTLKYKNIIDYYYTKKNTYLLLKAEIYYLYNINTKEYTEINIENYNKYEFGFYFFNNNILKIYNLNSNKEQEYHNFNNLQISTISNNKLYFYDNNLNILDLETNNLTRLEETNIEDIIVLKNEIFIKQDNNYKYLNIEEPEPSVSTIENEYNLKIYTKDKAIIKFPDFHAEVEYNNETINNALNRFEPMLNKLSSEFFKDFPTINLYLTSTLFPSDYNTQVSNPAAYSLYYNDKYMIVININEPNLEEIIAHELMHNLEYYLKNNNQEPFSKWNELNPQEFNYLNSYTKESPYDYTLNDIKEEAYFIDKYSHTYAEEDRARIFEVICTNKDISQYPKINAKANYLKEELIKYYPTLKGLDF